MSSRKLIFDVDGTISEGSSQMEHEDKPILRNWLKILDYMQVARRDPKKLALVSKKIKNVLNEVKALYGSTRESKISELELFIGSNAPEQIDILPPKLSNTKGSSK